MNEEYGGVLQFFYHCPDEILPIRDIRYRGKTEPHYENLTENWCSECMNQQIRSVNSRQLDYLILLTRYNFKGHKFYDKYLIVGYLKRADVNRFIKLNHNLIADVHPFEPDNPETCGFFAGDLKESKFVSADDAYILEGVTNFRHNKRLVSSKYAKSILHHFENKRNILPELIAVAKRLTAERKKNESCSSSCRY